MPLSRASHRGILMMQSTRFDSMRSSFTWLLGIGTVLSPSKTNQHASVSPCSWPQNDFAIPSEFGLNPFTNQEERRR